MVTQTPKFLSFTCIVDISALRNDIKNLSVHSFLHLSQFATLAAFNDQTRIVGGVAF